MYFEKSQWVRLFDVLVLGPFLIWFGLKHNEDWTGTAVIIAGVMTVLYNGYNWLGNVVKWLPRLPF
jgi:hypothetical protein